MSHILIADDDATQLELRKYVLERQGHEVSVALTAAQARRAIRERAPDLVILDVRFPDVQGNSDPDEGLALIRDIRESGCETPVLVLAGWPEDLEGRPEARMVTRIMPKPVRPAVLMEAVREMIA